MNTIRERIRTRLFSRVALAKLGGATAISGLYFSVHGPLASFESSVYGVRSWFSWIIDMPNGISGGKPVVTEALNKLIEETKRDLRLSPVAKEKLQFKSGVTASPSFVGSGEYFTAYAVLPDHLNVSSISDLRSESLNDYLQALYEWNITDSQLWLTGAGKLLVDSFVMSEKAKKFLIARQAYLADNRNCLSLTPPVFILTYIFYITMDIVEQQTRGRPIGPIARFVVPAVVGIMIFGNFFLMRFFTVQKQYADADAKAVTRGLMDYEQIREAQKKGQPLPIDPEYCAGAIEFYNKEIQRNLSLRHLMKKTNPWYSAMFGSFTEQGDYMTSILSYDPRPSRCLRKITAWKMGEKAPEYWFDP